MDLPYTAAVIREAFDFIGSLVEDLFQSPVQATSHISRVEQRFFEVYFVDVVVRWSF